MNINLASSLSDPNQWKPDYNLHFLKTNMSFILLPHIVPPQLSGNFLLQNPFELSNMLYTYLTGIGALQMRTWRPTLLSYALQFHIARKQLYGSPTF